MPTASCLPLVAIVLLASAGADAADVSPAAPETFRDCPGCPEMVVVPAGSFVMGTPATGGDAAETRAEAQATVIRIARPFALGRHEVTRGEFAEFVRESGYEVKPGCRTWDAALGRFNDDGRRTWQDPGIPVEPTDQHPVTCVAWADAQPYARWLAQKDHPRNFRPGGLPDPDGHFAGLRHRVRHGSHPDPGTPACTWCSTMRTIPRGTSSRESARRPGRVRGPNDGDCHHDKHAVPCLCQLARAAGGVPGQPGNGRASLPDLRIRLGATGGAQMYNRLKQPQGGEFILDPGLTAYVNEVGGRLAAQAQRKDVLQFEFSILNNSTPNKIIIAEVNQKLPRTLGDSFIHLSRLNYLVPVDYDLPKLLMSEGGPDPIVDRIAQHIAELIPDGATMQMGIGAIPDAVLNYLKDKKDLGIHTELFSDGVIELVEMGILNGSRISIHPGKMSAGFILGSRRLYEWVDDNPLIELHPTEYVNDPFVIAQNDKQVAVNSALEVDLTGQVCADSIGPKIYSGVGGQLDFVYGASRSKGGVPIIALPSTTTSAWRP